MNQLQFVLKCRGIWCKCRVTWSFFNRFWICHSLSHEQVQTAFYFLWIICICCPRNTAGAEIRRKMCRCVEHVSVARKTIMVRKVRRRWRRTKTRWSETSSLFHCFHQPLTYICSLQSADWQLTFEAISFVISFAQGHAREGLTVKSVPLMGFRPQFFEGWIMASLSTYLLDSDLSRRIASFALQQRGRGWLVW